MIAKGTLVIVAETLANRKFIEHCELLDTRLEECLRSAFKDEKISQKRLDRIINKFCENMEGEKK
ncbi:MAG TPA: hypothetical protein VIK72_19325 [Clostridiaceae bacterium]